MIILLYFKQEAVSLWDVKNCVHVSISEGESSKRKEICSSSLLNDKVDNLLEQQFLDEVEIIFEESKHLRCF